MQRPTGMIGFRVSPGEEQAIQYLDDIRLTNIAFGEEVKGTGRTVVRVHHRRNPEFDDLDDDLDLDDDDLDGDLDDDDEDEDEEEDEEEDAEAADAKPNGKAVKDADAEDEADDDDDDDDDESLFDEEDEEHTYILCSLYPGKIEQVTIDLSFTVADDVRFSLSGENAVEFMGNVMKPSLLDTYDEEPDDDEIISDYDDDESIDSDDAMYAEITDEEGDSEDDEDEENDVQIEEIVEDDGESQEEEEAKVVKPQVVTAGKKRTAAEADVVDETEEDISMTAPATDAEIASAAKAAGLDPSKLSKNQRKKLNKRLRGASGDESVEVESSVAATTAAGADGKPKTATAAKEAVKKDGKTVSKSTTLASGVVIEDRKIGSGPAAKAGNRLGMRYVGRLQNGKQFDANTKGKPFSFRLGKGEVIGGWDEGLKGMQAGGERRLVIPPKMGYGARGAPPDIPGNATLVFDVKLVEIK